MVTEKQRSAKSDQAIDAIEVVDNFKLLFSTLNVENCQGDLLDSVYRQDVVFEDCFHHIEGLPALQEYFQSLYENISYCHFHFIDHWLRPADAMLTWRMEYAHPKLNRGKNIVVDGASQIRFDHHIYYHRDYFDGGALLYEHVPVVGRIVQHLKQKLAD